MDKEYDLVPLGHISGVHGLKGWVKVFSLTDPRNAIFEYQPWLLGDEKSQVSIVEGREQGKYLIARFDKVEGRDQAEKLVQKSISVFRDQLPEPGDQQYYWLDLIGLDVFLSDGQRLGVVDRMMATGANDVIVVKGDGEHLIPFVMDRYITEVDIENRRIIADWELEF